MARYNYFASSPQSQGGMAPGNRAVLILGFSIAAALFIFRWR